VTLPLPEYTCIGQGDRTVVFLHGLGGDHTNWEPQLAEFSADYRCIAWTMPGFGDSPALDELTWGGLADAVARVLDHVGAERATVIGLSMGGYVAQQFAADYPERVDRLVLAATTAQFGRGSASFAEKFLTSRLAPIDAGQTPSDFAPTVAPNLLSDPAPAGAVENAVASMSRISPEAYRAALNCLVTWNFVERLSEITAPTLCLAGDDDRTAPPAAVQALADALPNATCEVIPHCQHLMNLDHPTEFNTRLHSVLAN